MKAASIIFYIIGAGLLIASVFTNGVSLTWWLGAGAIVALIVGAVCQFNVRKRNVDELIEEERRQ